MVYAAKAYFLNTAPILEGNREITSYFFSYRRRFILMDEVRVKSLTRFWFFEFTFDTFRCLKRFRIFHRRMFRFPTSTWLYRKFRLGSGARYKILKARYFIRQPLFFGAIARRWNYEINLRRFWKIRMTPLRWSSEMHKNRHKLLVRFVNLSYKCMLVLSITPAKCRALLKDYFNIFKMFFSYYWFKKPFPPRTLSPLDDSLRKHIIEHRLNPGTYSAIKRSVDKRVSHIQSWIGNCVYEHWWVICKWFYGPNYFTEPAALNYMEVRNNIFMARRIQLRRYRDRRHPYYGLLNLQHEISFIDNQHIYGADVYWIYFRFCSIFRRFEITDFTLIRRSRWMGRFWFFR